MAKNSSSARPPSPPTKGAIKPGASVGGSAHASTMPMAQRTRLNSGMNRC